MVEAHPIRRIRRDGGVDLLGRYEVSGATRRLVLEQPGYPLLGPGVHVGSRSPPVGDARTLSLARALVERVEGDREVSRELVEAWRRHIGL